MNTEDMLTALFTDQAEQRPDPGTVFEELHQHLARRRRVTLTRTAGTLGAAAAVAAVAVGATVLSAPHDNRSAPAGAAHPAPTQSTATNPTPSTTTRLPQSTSAAAPTISLPLRGAGRPPQPSPATSGGPSVVVPGGSHDSRDYSTINAGYLPGPATQDPAGTSNKPGFEERDWDVTVDGVAMDVIIWTETGTLPTRMQATGGGQPNYQAVTVNGHPGREFVSSNITIIAFDLGNGTIAYTGPSVQHTTNTVTTARISTIALKVAQNMQFNRHDPIPTR